MKKFFVFTLLLLSMDAHAGFNESDSLRCGNSIVSKGDGKHEVTEKCGKPARIDTIYVRRYNGTRSYEQWTYDFGPQEFVYLVRFEGNGTVSHMYNTGNYGVRR